MHMGETHNTFVHWENSGRNNSYKDWVLLCSTSGIGWINFQESQNYITELVLINMWQKGISKNKLHTVGCHRDNMQVFMSLCVQMCVL